jgi:hypothetical protein
MFCGVGVAGEFSTLMIKFNNEPPRRQVRQEVGGERFAYCWQFAIAPEMLALCWGRVYW